MSYLSYSWGIGVRSLFCVNICTVRNHGTLAPFYMYLESLSVCGLLNDLRACWCKKSIIEIHNFYSYFPVITELIHFLAN